MNTTELTNPKQHTNQRALSRDLYLQAVLTGLNLQELHFARETILAWLAAYPGDLRASLLYARVLLAEKRPRQAMPVLEGLSLADPEFLEAAEVLLQAEMQNGSRLRMVPGSAPLVFALGSQPSNEETIANWGIQLRQARQALVQRDFERAERLLHAILGMELPNPLAYVTHLEVLEASGQTPLPAKVCLARHYRQHWPDCLPIQLMLADWLMDGGEYDQAVELLHQAASRDIGGQVAGRMWGSNHPYTRIWPEKLVLPIEAVIPASVAVSMGWNQLLSGLESLPSPAAPATSSPTILPQLQKVEEATLPEIEIPFIPLVSKPAPPISTTDRTHITPVIAAAAIAGTLSDKLPTDGKTNPAQSLAQPARPASTPTLSETQPVSKTTDPISAKPAPHAEVLRSLQLELERVAANHNLTDIARADGRFPIYVVFSVRSGLEAQYGPQAMPALEAAMNQLVQAIQGSRMRNKKRWGARLFFADDPLHTTPLGFRPARPGDPWELKLALEDLDNALCKQGQRIGALLIIGGPAVVPFHHLPNPVDDQDGDVPSDNPYGTRDENYFIPEWPVGRLPGSTGSDPSLLLDGLHRMAARHAAQARRPTWLVSWLEVLPAWLRRRKNRAVFGYSAAVWRQNSLAVLRPVGSSGALYVSPPLKGEGVIKQIGDPLQRAKLGYFNLHGLPDAGEWYGQSDPLQTNRESEYPVALRPQDILPARDGEETFGPHIIFTEACYGMNILGKAQDEALAFKFLAAGSMAIAGATCMAYGSIGTPLAAADLLGQAFWHFIRSGLTAGEALQQAKIYLAREMDRRQGYLDGEDQKTLISFVLYGDPLAQPLPVKRRAKTLPRLEGYTIIKTIQAPDVAHHEPEMVPAEVLASIKQVVAKYLPGMEGAELRFAKTTKLYEPGSTSVPCPEIDDNLSPGRTMSGKAAAKKRPTRRLVTLSKTIPQADHVHVQYAHLTLDGKGKLVKLVVSR